MRIKSPTVYILASRQNGTLYIGMTSALHDRMAQHTQKLIPGFTSQHNVTLLVYYEMHETLDRAIAREKQLKEWRRLWKLRLIEQMNPQWLNLFDPQTGEIAAGPFDKSEHLFDERLAPCCLGADLRRHDGGRREHVHPIPVIPAQAGIQTTVKK